MEQFGYCWRVDMSSGSDRRQRNRARSIAKAAFKLRQEGRTNDQIAEQLGIDKKVVPARVQLGERLEDAGL